MPLLKRFGGEQVHYFNISIIYYLSYELGAGGKEIGETFFHQ